MDNPPEECTPEEVISAIEKYRKIVAEDSYKSLEWLIVEGEKQELEPPWKDADESLILEGQMRSCEEYLGFDLPDFKHPRELLSRFDEIVERCCCNGVKHLEILTLARGSAGMSTEAHIRVLEKALQDNTYISVPFLVSVPEEYKTLMRHVDSLIGVGLLYQRSPPLWAGCTDSEDEIKQRIVAKDYMKRWHDDYEVAAGWEAGDSREGFIFVMLCRNEKKGKPWRWRYTRVDWCEQYSEVFDSIPSFLEFYAQDAPEPINEFHWLVPLDMHPLCPRDEC
ncbi:hypothetical protein H109_03987 [Trichophyton interdigitale MR816]|uniref:Uncharacterized protein n=1 Tax=Trichophyton interdigitale (strain MR816) TaxID=1215338 RepID=A0A059J9J4_TRIIM|nr:hypothetical protein H101_02174 [Trichophyton interdigitale H6]KDB24132.1 hypothetical protein H109_03987 [Trichophyton interdigitale MR816]